MKKIIALALTVCVLLCCAACQKSPDAREIYSSASGITSMLDYQKFDLSVYSVLSSNGKETPSGIDLYCKFIKENGKITSYYSERMLTLANEESTVTAKYFQHYIKGTVYQTFSTNMMKHTLSAEDFAKKYPDLGSFIIALPDGALDGIDASKNADGGHAFTVSVNTDLLSDSDKGKLLKIAELYGQASFDGDISLGSSLSVSASTTYDGYFDEYSLSFDVSGKIDGKDATLSLNTSLKILYAGSQFVIEPPSKMSDYTEGSLDIG